MIVVRPFKGSNTTWEYDIRIDLPDGREVRERRKSKLTSKSGTQRFAEARERELYAQHTAVEAAPAIDHGPTVAAYVPKYIAHCTAARQKPSTIDGKSLMLSGWVVPRLGTKHLGEVTTADLARLKADLTTANVSATYGNSVARALTNMLRTAIELGIISTAMPTYKPFKRVLIERPFYDPTQIDRLCAAAKDERALVTILLGAHAGLRAGEIIGLQWSDIDWARNTIYVQRSVWRGKVGLPKHNRLRRVPMTARLTAALKAFRHLRGQHVLFTAEAGQACRPIAYPHTLRLWLRAVEQAAGLEPLGHMHVLRHSYCSNLAAAGVPVRTLMELAGHGDLATAMRYMHLGPSAAGDAVRVLDRPVQNLGDAVETLSTESVS